MKLVSNSGPLMALAEIGQIHLLHPFYGATSISESEVWQD